MSSRIANSLCLCAFVAVLGGSAWAQTPSSTAFVRSDDEKSLTDIQLVGKRIFEDASLSEPRGMSCMSCHAPKHAFQGNNHSPVAAIAAGSTPDKLGTSEDADHHVQDVQPGVRLL